MIILTIYKPSFFEWFGLYLIRVSDNNEVIFTTKVNIHKHKSTGKTVFCPPTTPSHFLPISFPSSSLFLLHHLFFFLLLLLLLLSSILYTVAIFWNIYSHILCVIVDFGKVTINTKQLKCYSQILCGGFAENFRFWLFCIDLVGNW